MIDQRQYVRVEALMPVRYRILAEEEYEEARKRCLEHKLLNHDGHGTSVLHDIDMDLLRNPTTIPTEGMDPLIGRALSEIDGKINLILRILAENRLSEMRPERHREVNLSGGGLRIPISDPLKTDDKVELEITLPLFPPVTMLTVARVARVVALEQEGTEPLYDTALEFIDIDEGNREKIIQYVFKRQRQTLRKRAVRKSGDQTPA